MNIVITLGIQNMGICDDISVLVENNSRTRTEKIFVESVGIGLDFNYRIPYGCRSALGCIFSVFVLKIRKIGCSFWFAFLINYDLIAAQRFDSAASCQNIGDDSAKSKKNGSCCKNGENNKYGALLSDMARFSFSA